MRQVCIAPGQDEIDFSTPVAKPPVATTDDVQCLVGLLKGKGWLKAEHLAAISGGALTDRKVRRIARAARPGVVSYPGSPGYKLWEECSVEEINHAIAAFDSQAKDMIACGHIYRMAYHARFRGQAVAVP